MKNISKNSICQLISERFPSVSFVFLYGSVNFGTNNAESDVDCIVVTKEIIRPFREHFSAMGKIFDVYVFDSESLHAAMRNSHAAGTPMLINSIASAQILPGPDKTAERLIEIAKELRAAERPPSFAIIRTLRESLGATLDDLKVEVAGFEKTMRFIELVALISKYRTLMLGEGGHSYRYTARIMLSHDEPATKYLNEAFQLALIGAPTRLLELAEQTLDALGGRLRGEYKVMITDHPRVPLWNDGSATG